MRFLSAAFPLTVVLLLGACASLSEKFEKLTISDPNEADFKPVEAKAESGLTPYKAGKATLKAEWFACKLGTGDGGSKGTVLIMHTDRAGFAKAAFCGGWMAQTFLSQGFDVLTVNRPGYGASTGHPDFGGDASMAAVKAVVGEVKFPKPVTGAWGYGSGAAAAGLAAKQLGNLTFLILGGGIYDYDDALKTTADPYLKADLETLKKSGGDHAFEQRSIAYDTSGYPQHILIYHGAQDTAIKPAQAKSFADSLESSGQYKVNYQQIDGIGHEIPWVHHRKILEQLVVLATATPGK